MSRSLSLSNSVISLFSSLENQEFSGSFYIAYSGGVDSHVLLHIMHSLKKKLSIEVRAVHVNHSLHESSDIWSEHCQKTCNELGVDCSVLRIEEPCPAGESVESWARKCRYDLIISEMEEDAVLLTAHHQDDQAETLLLQMIRGAGPSGLSSMPVVKKKGAIWLLRPFLNHTRAVLKEYAEEHNLIWIEDDSNHSSRYDRNYLRKEIFPHLSQRWPGIVKTLSRVASHQAEVSTQLAEHGKNDLSYCSDDGHNIIVKKLLEFNYARRSNVLRCWLTSNDIAIPDEVTIKRIQLEMLEGTADKQLTLEWAGHEIHAYKDNLYIISRVIDAGLNQPVFWDLNKTLARNSGTLSAVLKKGPGIRQDAITENTLEVRQRCGGEKIQLHNKTHRQSIKKLFQEREVPPFIRKRIPFLYLNDDLIAVAGLFINKDIISGDEEVSWQINWSPLKHHQIPK